MPTPKPHYKDFVSDEQCPNCKRVMLWYHFYTTYCGNCDYSFHDHQAEKEDFNAVEEERKFIFNENGGNDRP